MRRTLVFIACIWNIASVFSQTRDEITKKYLQAEYLRLSSAAVMTEPYVAFINIGNALGEKQFIEAVATVNQNIIPIRTGIKVLRTLPNISVLARPVYTSDKWARLSVFIVKNPELPPIIAVPGVCSVINLYGLDTDKPSAEKLDRRVKQVVLRGFGFACGAGGTVDTRCVMCASAFTLKGLDMASVSFSPLAYGPIQECLQRLGGNALLLVQ